MSTEKYTIKQCPECGEFWDTNEIEDQACDACGFGKEPGGMDEGDDDFEPEYYQCLGCQWSGVENPGPICPRCNGATVEGVY